MITWEPPAETAEEVAERTEQFRQFDLEMRRTRATFVDAERGFVSARWSGADAFAQLNSASVSVFA